MNARRKTRELLDHVQEQDAYLEQVDAILKNWRPEPGTPWPTDDIDLAYIKLDKNHRKMMNPVKLQELAVSIQASGQESLIRVHRAKHGLELVYGHRRMEACRLAGKSTVRAEILPELTPAEVSAMRAVENIQREDLNRAEEVVLVAEMMEEFHHDRETVAAELGKSVRWVSDRIYLARLHPLVLDLVAVERLPLGHARLIATIGNPGDQAWVAAQACNLWNWYGQATDYLAGKRKSLPDGLDLHDGRYHIDSLEKTREHIASRTRSLRLVGWELGQALGTDLPACIGCKHNTKSDPALFEGLTPDESGTGQCMNQLCYEAKQELVAVTVAEAKRKAAHALETTGEAPKPREVREDVPAGIKTLTVERAVKEEIQTRHENAQAATQPKSHAAESGRRSNEKALADYRHALEAWKGETLQKLQDGTTPVTRLAIITLHANAGTLIPHYQPTTYGKKQDEPNPIEPLSAGAIHAIQAAAAEDMAAVVKAAPPSDLIDEIHSPHPDFLVELAKAAGVQIEAPPAWITSTTDKDTPKPKNQARN